MCVEVCVWFEVCSLSVGCSTCGVNMYGVCEYVCGVGACVRGCVWFGMCSLWGCSV